MSKFIIALTGGYCSGKTVVANFFSELGVPVFDADKIVKDVTKAGTTYLKEIVKHFGNQILNNDGELNRRQLKTTIFNDPNERQWLEDLLHPIVRQTLFTKARLAKFPYCILDIPLLVETLNKHNEISAYMKENIYRIIVVDTTEALQKERAAQRDKLPNDLIDSILKTQISRSARLKIANDIISNVSNNLEQVKQQVDELHEKYISITNH